MNKTTKTILDGYMYHILDPTAHVQQQHNRGVRFIMSTSGWRNGGYQWHETELNVLPCNCEIFETLVSQWINSQMKAGPQSSVLPHCVHGTRHRTTTLLSSTGAHNLLDSLLRRRPSSILVLCWNAREHRHRKEPRARVEEERSARQPAGVALRRRRGETVRVRTRIARWRCGPTNVLAFRVEVVMDRLMATRA